MNATSSKVENSPQNGYSIVEEDSSISRQAGGGRLKHEKRLFNGALFNLLVTSKQISTDFRYRRFPEVDVTDMLDR